MSRQKWVVVGGAGLTGSALVAHLCERGDEVVIIDRHRPSGQLTGDVSWLRRDLLRDDLVLPDGRIVLTFGNSDRRPVSPWTVALDNAVTTARLVPALAGREVVLVSSVEVYGSAVPPFEESTEPRLPWSQDDLAAWCSEALAYARAGPCPPWKVAALCRKLADADPTGSWVYALTKRAQEWLVIEAATKALWILRAGRIFGNGQNGFVAELARCLLAGRAADVAGGAVCSLVDVGDLVVAMAGEIPPGIYNVAARPALRRDIAEMVRAASGNAGQVVPVSEPVVGACGPVDSSKYRTAGGRLGDLGVAVGAFVRTLVGDERALFDPPIEVICPARPARPDVLAERQSAALWSGGLKAGHLWSRVFTERLAAEIGVTNLRCVIATVSGTAALRMAVAAIAGPAKPGAVAVLPSYTYPVTAEVLVQLGYGLVFADVDPDSWTISAAHVERIVSGRHLDLVVAVDTFGNPADYTALQAVCTDHEIPLVADSAGAFGSRVDGVAVGSQAGAHAFSMSFAKTLTAGGAGGAVVLPAEAVLAREAGWDRSEQMAELHAIAGLDQLEILDRLVARRAAIVATYRALLDGHPDLQLQKDGPRTEPCFSNFVVRVSGRDREETAAHLSALGIGTKVYFPALHRTTHQRPAASGELEVTDTLHRESLALPLSSEMTVSDAELVVAGLERALARSTKLLRPRPAGSRQEHAATGETMTSLGET